MKRIAIFLGLLALSSITHAGEKNQPRTDNADAIQQALSFRQQVNDFYANPDVEAATTISSRWEVTPSEIRRRIESRHPGTNQRILNLRSEIDTVTAPAPREKVIKKDDNVTDPDDQVATPEVAQVPDDNPATGETPAPELPSGATERKVPHPRRTTTPLAYSDELDIFGNRPRPMHKP